jgi:thiol-disulfide isomerase/thioredoxin
MILEHRIPRLLLALFVFGCLILGKEAASQPAIGESAPPIIASKWIRGAPVDHFVSGRVYVVDLWSTWCRPCIASMPVLHALEAKFAKKVTFIAMDVWELDPSRIPAFMKTHADSMLSVVALDSVPTGKEANEGFTAKEYVGTSESASIPKTFIIDQQGKVVWIGLPGEMENPLSLVLEGKWDVAAFAKAYNDKAAASKKPAEKQ